MTLSIPAIASWDNRGFIFLFSPRDISRLLSSDRLWKLHFEMLHETVVTNRIKVIFRINIFIAFTFKGILAMISCLWHSEWVSAKSLLRYESLLVIDLYGWSFKATDSYKVHYIFVRYYSHHVEYLINVFNISVVVKLTISRCYL